MGSVGLQILKNSSSIQHIFGRYVAEIHNEENGSLTLSTVTKFLESICILLPFRYSEFGLMPGGGEREDRRG